MPLTQLHHAMESFYLSSHLSICALSSTGTFHSLPEASAPLITYIETWLNLTTCSFSQEIKKVIADHENLLDQQQHIIYSPEEAVHFSLCPIVPSNPAQGFYIFGPYTSSVALKDRFLYKPLHCIKPLIQLLYAFHETEHQPTCQCEPSSMSYNYHVRKAMAYIDHHYQEPITLDELAAHLGLNKSYLCTLFKQCTNDSICNYINTVRIEKSKDLLTHTASSILDIGLQVGFSSGSYYNTLFKKLTGLTPLAYRSQYIQGDDCKRAAFLFPNSGSL